MKSTGTLGDSGLKRAVNLCVYHHIAVRVASNTVNIGSNFWMYISMGRPYILKRMKQWLSRFACDSCPTYCYFYPLLSACESSISADGALYLAHELFSRDGYLYCLRRARCRCIGNKRRYYRRWRRRRCMRSRCIYRISIAITCQYWLDISATHRYFLISIRKIADKYWLGTVMPLQSVERLRR